MEKLILMLLLFPTLSWGAEKAIYVDREWETSPWAAYQVLNKLTGFNHIIVMLGNTDPATIKAGSLEYFINQAHKKGIRISLCLNVTSSPDTVHFPGYPADIAAFFETYARKYQADGINLDLVRTNGYCKTEPCKADFLQRFGISLDEVLADIDYNGWFSPYRPQVSAWNGEVVRRAIEAIKNAVRAIKPNIEISVDSYSHPCWEMEGAFPNQWINTGLVDHYYVMDYAEQVDIEALNQYLIPVVAKDKFTIAIGNFYMFWVKPANEWVDMYSRDPKHVDALKKSIEGTGSGYAIYSYRFMRQQ